MDIRLFKTFLLVAKLLNITKAAEQLSFSQPAISAQIYSLEDAFHVRLFKRNGKRLALTEAGKKMVEYAGRMTSLYEEAQNAMRDFSRGEDTLRLGVSTQMINYFLPPILKQLQNEMPHVHVSVEICMSTQEVLKGMAEQRYDFGFIHGQNTVPQLSEHLVWSEKVLWVASPDFINKQPIQNIEKYPFINYTEGSVLRTKLEKMEQGSDFHATIEYSDSEAIKRAVMSGLGISYLPQSLVEDEVARNKLVVLEHGPQIQLCISLVHHNDKAFSLSMYALLLALANKPGVNENIKMLL